jgi:tRNA threonylcarbamoyladenosine biosynthesis protein TsaE
MSQIVFDTTVGIDQLDTIAQKLHDIIHTQDMIVLLQGEVASGKTTLVQQYLKHIGAKHKATSPTFSLQNIYDKDIYHYDIYNTTVEKFISLGLLFEFEKTGIHFVEWGCKLMANQLSLYGFVYITVQITKQQNKRRYKICTH